VSRVILLSMSVADVEAQCLEAKVGVSSLERLVSGGVRLVCMSTNGAALIRQKLESSIIEGHAVRERYRPATPLW
jgi:hypothetical protein